MTAEVAYVGSVGRRLPYAVGDINKIDLGTTNHHHITNDFGQIQGLFPAGSSIYHSLQAKLTKRYSGGLSFQGSYTYGKSIDNGPAPFNLGKGITNHNQPQNPFDLNSERAVSDNDITHNFVFNAVYELPFGKGKRYFGTWSGVTQNVLGGWQINGIFNANTGLPVNVIVNGDDRKGNAGLRPNLIKDPTLPRDERTLNRYFDTSAFCKPDPTTCPPDNADGLGDSPRNLLRGPGFVNTDFSLFKEFSFAETRKLQFRFEFFNLFNTPHFGNPAGDLSAVGSFGKIQSATGAREIQFALKFLF